MLVVYDLLVVLQIKYYEFEDVFESVEVVSVIFLWNFYCYVKVLDLFCLIYDYELQFEVVKKIVKIVKNLIYDKLEIYLNVVCLGIDFVMIVEEEYIKCFIK